MGLNATIYEDNDPETHPDAEIASFRIGNIGQVAYLSEAIEKIVPGQSVLMEKVLYSGSHAGDGLSLTDIRIALVELKLLTESQITDTFLLKFVSEFGELCHKAIASGKEIKF